MFTTLAVIATTAVAAVLAAWACYVGVELRRLRAALTDAAWQLVHDPLTGLLNRAGLLAAHTTLAETPQPILVALIDLDSFKAVNDTHGHDTGDQLLIEIADRVEEVAALYGGVAARLSGDEYAALLPVRDHDIARIAAVLVAVIAEPARLEADDDIAKVDVTASIGVAVVDSTDAFGDIALHRADVAMYHAKNGGGNQHAAYTPGMTMPTRTPRRGPRPRDFRLSDQGRGA
ncbi:GGDEF domain-containing protein [Micromonospora sp. NPDC051296]|uniref:GGDEF domain-containing protein n=1 Tax=Micromonospora sp. NPDC051296 TaxID=3155046 RepID=UPI0034334F10